MNGSIRINPAQKRVGAGSAAALEIRLSDDTVAFYDSAVEIR